jgi:hypothetical protein
MEFMIAPNKFTQDFFDMDFSNFKFLLDGIKDADHPAFCDLPVVPIDYCNELVLKQLYNMCNSRLVDKFVPVVSTNYYNHWHSMERSFGWAEIPIKINDNIETMEIIANKKIKMKRENKTKLDRDIVLTCKNIFKQDIWQSIEQLLILRLDPKGWVQPHRDIFTKSYRLCHFWIPLHEFEKGIKIFPYGWLKNKFGNMYLLNQGRYPHSIINNSNHDRFVIVGKFNTTQVPTQIIEIFNLNKKKLDLWL